MEQSLNDLLSEALLQWVELTGVNTSKKEALSLGEYELQRSTEELNESWRLDETGITPWMMLRGFAEQYMKEREFSAFNIIFDPAPIQQELNAMRKLHIALEDPLVLNLISSFVEKIRNRATQYGFKDVAGLERLLADKYDLAWIRRDALRSMDRLNIHQFTQGEGDPTPIGLNTHVYEMWNVNSLVRALRGQGIPGITVVLIRDPQALHSFFVFAVKNGDNITILTDKDEEEHPASKRMSRRPDRELQRRAEKHWFPYHLLDLKTTEDGKHMYAEARTAVVPININAVQLAPITDLSPEQFVWLVLLSDLIRDKLWVQNYHTKQLSYTGEMVVEPQALVGANSALVKAGMYTLLEMPALSRQDVTSETTANQWRQKPIAFNQWMIDRYENQVPEDVFNVVGPSNVRRIEDIHGLEQRREFYGSPRENLLEHLDTQNFGTKEKLEKDRIWAARVNQMHAINKLAKDEHEATKKELLIWLHQKLESRGDFFADAAAKGELLGPVFTRGESFDGTKAHITTGKLLHYQIQAKRYGGEYEDSYVYFPSRDKGDMTFTDYAMKTYPCYDRPDVNASIFTIFVPNCPEALAIFLGVPVTELPWQLKNWHPNNIEPYAGNHLLNRLDPIDWVLNNPWGEYKFRVGMSLSKRAYAARRKALNLPPNEVPFQKKR